VSWAYRILGYACEEKNMFLVVGTSDDECRIYVAVRIDGLNVRTKSGRPRFHGKVFDPIPTTNDSYRFRKRVFDGERERSPLGGHSIFLGRAYTLECPKALDNEREDMALLLAKWDRLSPDNGFNLSVLREMRFAAGMVGILDKMRSNFAFIREIHHGLRAWWAVDRHFREQTVGVLKVRDGYKKRTVPGEDDLQYFVTMAIGRYRYYHTLGEESFDLHLVSALTLELPNKPEETCPPRSNDANWTASSRSELVGTLHLGRSVKTRGEGAQGEGDRHGAISASRSRRSGVPRVRGRPRA
jgi:hypothetical protein